LKFEYVASNELKGNDELFSCPCLNLE